ncbi:MAG TPA: fibronectin type III domain-containing protein, partial [Nitrospirota bacterium]|nr:fibronectin type III domain-containing protein [Nitrospirota bacterium]
VFSGPDHDYDDFRLNAQGDYDGVSGGAHDKYDDPLYVGGGDYRLQTSPAMSPCIDAGVDVGLQYVGLPDMGAYESASVQPSPWPPEGLTATPRSAMVKLGWLPNLESDIAGYKVSYGNVPGSYTSTLDAGNVTEYDVRSLINGASYFFAVRAYNTLSNLSDYSDEAGATPTAGTPELPHYDWDGSYGPNCSGCHYRDTGSGELLPQGYDYRYSTALCTSCHNLAGQARAMTVSGQSHPVLVNATTGGNNVPTYGNITGRYSNSMGDNLKPGNIIVCNTCHNMMEKTEDPGRTWELTTRYDGASFDLQRGGWSWYGYMLPEVYSSVSFMPSAPSYIKDRRPMKVSPSRYGYNQAAGRITFSVGFNDYVYVSLRYPYLRVDNTEDVMCLDCHNMGTHQRINCLTCHESHNYENRHGIRPVIKTPNSGIKGVVFKRVTGVNSFADADGLYDGVCQVCHTQTTYFRNDGSGFANHSSGVTYSGSDCSACHTHESGFSKY